MKRNNDKNNLPDEELFSLKDFLKLCLGSWKWFLASLIFFIGVAIFYLAKKEPVYERSEQILVKDQDSGGGVSNISNSFSSMGLVTSNTKVYNELIAFTSPAVMQEVVKRLDLTMNYTLRKGLKPHTLYNTSNPYNVVFEDLGENESAGFKMKIHPNGTYTIYKVWQNLPSGREKYDGEFSGSIPKGATKTPVGKILIERNPYYLPNSEIDTEEVTIDVFKNGFLSTVENYLGRVKGDLVDQDADVIELTLKDVCPRRADDILNSIVQIYNERWIEDKNKIAVATSKFISDRLKVIENELGNVDNEISEFKSEIKVPDVMLAAQGYMEQDFKMNEEILTQTSLLAMTTFLKEYLDNPANRYSIIPMNTGTQNVVLEEQIGMYNEKLLTRNNLVENSSPNNPIVRDLDNELSGLRTSIIQSTNSYITNLKNSLQQITKAQAESKEQLSVAPLQANSLLSSERQQLVMQELYLYLLQKREETELSQSFTADNVRIITPPYGPIKPVSPKKFLTLFVAFFLGLLIPAAAMYIAEESNTKLRSKRDLDDLPVPFAGEIPYIGKKKKWKKFLQTKRQKQKEIDRPKAVVSEGKRDIPNEAFRVVRSNIDFMLAKDSNVAPVVALTSFNPGSGKSFVAFNLGMSFALKGKNILLIDGDLRHGSLSAYVNSPRKGLTTYLNGETDDWNKLTVPVPEKPNLRVLPIGHRPPNPAEILDNGRLTHLLNEAKYEYDLIFIDCPPINIVVDTHIINPLVDRTIFVVRAGLFEKSGLKDLIQIYEEKKLNNMSLLLNGTQTEFSTYHTYGNYEAMDYDK